MICSFDSEKHKKTEIENTIDFKKQYLCEDDAWFLKKQEEDDDDDDEEEEVCT